MPSKTNGRPYTYPEVATPAKVRKDQILLVANGDLRLAANQRCWAAQEVLEHSLTEALAEAGYELSRAHPYKPDQQHGFISSQKEGLASSRGHSTFALDDSPKRRMSRTRFALNLPIQRQCLGGRVRLPAFMVRWMSISMTTKAGRVRVNSMIRSNTSN
jgi:hypothetical protein